MILLTILFLATLMLCLDTWSVEMASISGLAPLPSPQGFAPSFDPSGSILVTSSTFLLVMEA